MTISELNGLHNLTTTNLLLNKTRSDDLTVPGLQGRVSRFVLDIFTLICETFKYVYMAVDNKVIYIKNVIRRRLMLAEIVGLFKAFKNVNISPDEVVKINKKLESINDKLGDKSPDSLKKLLVNINGKDKVDGDVCITREDIKTMVNLLIEQNLKWEDL